MLHFSKEEESYLKSLRTIFQRLRDYSILLNPKKCKFGLTEVKYVGHLIDVKGVTFSPAKKEKALSFVLPRNMKEMKSFLGFANYFRGHIRNYTTLTCSLTALTAKYVAKKSLTYTPKEEKDFHNIVEAIGQCPKLYFMDDNAPITVMTDASDYGIGGYIYQTIGGVETPIAMMSKSLNKTEQNWTVEEKEAYAIYYTLRKYEYLLKGVKFTLLTDHKNLIYLNEEKKEKVKRWKIAIQDYDFTLKYIKGEDNYIADTLSRLCEREEKVSINLIHIDRIHVVDRSKKIEETIIPQHIYKLLGSFHNSTVGHRGIRTTIDILQEYKHNWKNRTLHVEAFIKKCPVCQKQATNRSNASIPPFTLASYKTMERIAMDTIVNLPADKEGYKHVIVIVDAFSRWVELYKVKDLSAETAVDALTDWVCRFGAPSGIVSDNGTQFVNEAVQGMMKSLEIEHLLIQAYSHEENGMVERANKEVKRHLRNIVFNFKKRNSWTEYLPLVRRIINASTHSATGYRPSEVVYGKHISLNKNFYPDNNATATGDVNMSTEEYLNEMETRHNEVVELARKSQEEIDANNNAKRMPDRLTEF